MQYISYSNLIKSDLSWFEFIPEHWNIRRFRHLFSFGRGLGITKANLKDVGIPCINYGEIHSTLGFEVNPEIDDLKCVDESYLVVNPSALLERGHFVFADTSEDLEGSGNFTYLNSDSQVFAGYHTVIAKLLTDDNPRYIAYLFDSVPFRLQIRKSVTGVKVFSITQAILKSSYLLLPPKKEQQKIVHFLDYKTNKIDVLIKKKKEILNKLEEKRVAIISIAVTKGIASNPPSIDSKIKWLGHIPAHWDIRRLRFVIKSNPVKSELSLQVEPDTLVSFVPMNAVGANGGIRLDTDKEVDDVYSGYTYFKDEDVVVAKITPCFENGKGALATGLTNGIGFGTTELHVLRSQPNYSSRWIFYLSISHAFRNIGESEMYGAGGQKRVPENFIKNFRLGIPPYDEQEKIADYLDDQVQKIDKMKAINNTAIEKLLEYRSSLITDAVTGQIDVRDIEISQE
jgi:type I restriction enzyme S subunit